MGKMPKCKFFYRIIHLHSRKGHHLQHKISVFLQQVDTIHVCA